jgi:hypothetical protein
MPPSDRPVDLSTRFRPDGSSLAERIVTMCWPVTGFTSIAGLGIIKAMV